MQDDWAEILGDITNSLAAFDKIEQKIAPKLAEIQQNADTVNPELKALLDKEMLNLSGRRAELDTLKETLRNTKI
jgi:prefoldin subunit 5